jgi:hypothetical protein
MSAIRRLGPAALLVAAIFLLSACASPITSGTVTAKQDTPAYWTVIQVPQYRTQCDEEEEPQYTGGTVTEVPEEVCTQVLSYYLPVNEFVPEEWQLRIKDGTRTGWVDVTQAVYDSARTGAHWSAS